MSLMIFRTMTWSHALNMANIIKVLLKIDSNRGEGQSCSVSRCQRGEGHLDGRSCGKRAIFRNRQTQVSWMDAVFHLQRHRAPDLMQCWSWSEPQLLPGNRQPKGVNSEQKRSFSPERLTSDRLTAHGCCSYFLLCVISVMQWLMLAGMSSKTLSAEIEKQIRRLCLNDFPCGNGSWVSFAYFFCCQL